MSGIGVYIDIYIHTLGYEKEMGKEKAEENLRRATRKEKKKEKRQSFSATGFEFSSEARVARKRLLANGPLQYNKVIIISGIDAGSERLRALITRGNVVISGRSISGGEEVRERHTRSNMHYEMIY